MAQPLFRRVTAALCAAALVVSGTGAALAQSAGSVIGIASAVVSNVDYSRSGMAKPAKVVLRQRMAMGDLIRTGKKAQLQILLLDRSTFSVGPRASLKIDRFVYDPAKGRGMAASVAKGAFRFMSGRPNRGRNGTSSISSPVATIGIRGTIVEGAVGETAMEIAEKNLPGFKQLDSDKENATLVVLRGPGAQTQAGLEPGAVSFTSTGGSVELTRPMQAAYVPRAGAAPVPFTISPEGLVMLDKAIFPAKYKGSGLLKGLLIGGALIALPVLVGSGRNNEDPQGPTNSTDQQPGVN